MRKGGSEGEKERKEKNKGKRREEGREGRGSKEVERTEEGSRREGGAREEGSGLDGQWVVTNLWIDRQLCHESTQRLPSNHWLKGWFLNSNDTPGPGRLRPL